MIYARRRLSPAVWVEPQAHQWWNIIVPQMTHRRFVSNFRVSRASFQYICRRLGPILERSDTNYRLAIPVDKRVAISLYKLASNLCYRLVAEQFGVGITTACHCLQDFCKAVIKVLLPDHIQDTVDQLSTLSVVSLGPVVACGQEVWLYHRQFNTPAPLWPKTKLSGRKIWP